MNLGLKTSYRDFYEYYKKQPSKNELIAEKKKEMGKKLDCETWVDLEVALGKFTAKFDSIDDFEKVYFDISDKLAEDIRLEEDKLVLSDEKKSKLCRDIISVLSCFYYFSEISIRQDIAIPVFTGFSRCLLLKSGNYCRRHHPDIAGDGTPQHFIE